MDGFNDGSTSPYLVHLLTELGMENVLSRLDVKEQWTHWCNKENSVSQFDFIILSPRSSKNVEKTLYWKKWFEQKD